jgi:hypothetical protein
LETFLEPKSSVSILVTVTEHKKTIRWLRLMLVFNSVSVPEVISVAEKLRMFEKRGLEKK